MSRQSARDENDDDQKFDGNPVLKGRSDVQSGHGERWLLGVETQRDGIAYFKSLKIVNVSDDTFVDILHAIYMVPVSYFLPTNPGLVLCLDNAVDHRALAPYSFTPLGHAFLFVQGGDQYADADQDQ
jgi:hypothetical protein